MKIIETQSAVLSNYEVLRHIQAVHRRYSQYPGYKLKTESSKYRPLAAVVSDLQEYLLHEKSPLSATSTALDHSVVPVPSEGADGTQEIEENEDEQNRKQPRVNPHYTDETPRKLLQRLARFHLTKSELLIILNLRPKDVAALDAMVEECDERFSAEQQEELVAIVAEVLGRPKDGEDEEEQQRHREDREAADTDEMDEA